MASSSLANVSVSLPFSSQRNVGAQASSCTTRFQPFPNCRMIMVGNRDYSHNSIRAIAGGDGSRRDNLDHLQKATKPQQSTTQTNKRVAQPIGLWDRYPTARTVQQMMDTMDRMMEDPVAYSNSSWSSPSVPRDNGTGGSGSYRRGRTPWEIKEGEQDYKMRFDMPGMTKGDVKVWVEEKMLVVKAEKVSKNNEESQKENENGEAWSSKSYGRYNFRIALPENVEFEKIKAEVKDGVLYISIPKATTSSKILDINVQ